ncbi:YhgE/Pip family protein [Fodinicola acaciae]|uniref:YhgE/Pip family protein n=1 Tax=Fodinicola acaciae TaxID=2681555 RepID=UPI0013D82714|nr:YhgE/Pip family protein [Fodinicola acaciae]
MFKYAARAIATGPLTWRTWAGLVILPVLIAAALTWAFWAPLTDHGTAKAAVVNADVPVNVKGQIVPLGRLLAGKLTHSADSNYSWVLTDAADAENGLADGTYAAAVTIPSNFSARATSTGNSDPMSAAQATLSVQTSNHAGVLDPIASKQVAQATVDTLNTQVVQTYLDNIYIGFSTLHGQLSDAADGANQLATGTGKLNTAAHQLATGASQLAAGSGQLASGLTQAEQQTANLPALTQKLAAGARQVANGNKQLANALVPLANKVIQVIDRLPSAQQAAAKFQQLASRCQSDGTDPQFCRDLRAAANRFSAEAKSIDGARTSIRAATVSIRDNITALANGANQVANGTAQLASKSGQLAGGIASAASGARTLSGGAHQLSSGAGQLATGMSSADAGAKKLASGLDSGAAQIPTYTPEQRSHLKNVAATPVAAGSITDAGFGHTAAAFFVVLALWCCALTTYVVTRAVPPSVLMSREPSWRTIFLAAQPGIAISLIVAAVLSLVFVPILKLNLVGWLGFFAVGLLAALTFTVVNQAFVAIFKRPGRFLSVAILLWTIATGVISTVPAVFTTVGAYLPTHGAMEALRAVSSGTGGAVSGIVELLVWLVIGSITMVFVTDRRRTLPAAALRLRST